MIISQIFVPCVVTKTTSKSSFYGSKSIRYFHPLSISLLTMTLTASKNTSIPIIYSISPNLRHSTQKTRSSPSAKDSATVRMSAPYRIATRSTRANLSTHRPSKPLSNINEHLTQVSPIFAHLSYYLCSQARKSRKLFISLQTKLRVR